MLSPLLSICAYEDVDVFTDVSCSCGSGPGLGCTLPEMSINSLNNIPEEYSSCVQDFTKIENRITKALMLQYVV